MPLLRKPELYEARTWPLVRVVRAIEYVEYCFRLELECGHVARRHGKPAGRLRFVRCIDCAFPDGVPDPGPF